jgi:dethiobiotin synthetase
MLRDPLAPEVAAGREGIRIDVRRIVRAFKKLQKEHEILIVEGAGGLFVPIKRKYFMIDLVAALAAPLVIVSRPGLGTINHTLLTCEAARTRSVDIVGIVINNYPAKASVAARTNPGIIRRYSGAALLGIMPRLPGVSVEKRKYEGLLEATEKNIDIPMILRKLRKNR